MASFELYFPRSIADDYISFSPNIFDAPAIRKIDAYINPYASLAFVEIYQHARKKLLGSKIPSDIIVYYYEGGVKKEYEVSCTLNREYQIDRLVTMHAVQTYRHPITEKLCDLMKDIDKFDLITHIDKIFAVFARFRVPFKLTGGLLTRFGILVHSSIKTMSQISSPHSPFSLSPQLVYCLARFIADNALVDEHLCAELNAICDEYVKNYIRALESVRVKLNRVLSGVCGYG